MRAATESLHVAFQSPTPLHRRLNPSITSLIDKDFSQGQPSDSEPDHLGSTNLAVQLEGGLWPDLLTDQPQVAANSTGSTGSAGGQDTNVWQEAASQTWHNVEAGVKEHIEWLSAESKKCLKGVVGVTEEETQGQPVAGTSEKTKGETVTGTAEKTKGQLAAGNTQAQLAAESPGKMKGTSATGSAWRTIGQRAAGTAKKTEGQQAAGTVEKTKELRAVVTAVQMKGQPVAGAAKKRQGTAQKLEEEPAEETAQKSEGQ